MVCYWFENNKRKNKWFEFQSIAILKWNIANQFNIDTEVYTILHHLFLYKKLM